MYRNSLKRALVVAMAGTLMAASVVVADNTLADGDGATPVADNALAFGSVACNAATSKTALIAINRVGGSAGNTFANDAVVAVTVIGFTGTGLSASVPAASTITLPNDWEDLANNTRSVGTVTATVSLTSTSAGPGTGTVTFRATGTNSAGTTTSRDKEMPVTWTTGTCTVADTTPPVITPNITGTLGNNGWYVSDVGLTWTVNDAESTVTSTSGCGDVSITADQSSTAYTCSATSAGGTNSVTVNIKRDATAPSISGSASPAPNGAGWNNTDVDVTYSCNDNLSGVASCEPDETLSSEGTGLSSTGTAVDNAGNSSAPTTVSGIKIDKTAPSLAPTVSPNPVVVGGSATASPGASDSLSGIMSASCDPVDTSAIGSYTVTCTATDNAGNYATADATYNVIYSWNGFFRPIDNWLDTTTPIVFNSLKAGQAVPIKFSLDGNYGLGIIISVTSKAVTCFTDAATSSDTPIVAAGGSSLSYDVLADQYNYVWKTEKGWANSCRMLTLTLNDDTPHVAYFKLLK